MTAAEFEKARAKYMRTYDRLYVASQKANTAAESAAIDRKLAAANRELQVAIDAAGVGQPWRAA